MVNVGADQLDPFLVPARFRACPHSNACIKLAPAPRLGRNLRTGPMPSTTISCETRISGSDCAGDDGCRNGNVWKSCAILTKILSYMHEHNSRHCHTQNHDTRSVEAVRNLRPSLGRRPGLRWYDVARIWRKLSSLSPARHPTAANGRMAGHSGLVEAGSRAAKLSDARAYRNEFTWIATRATIIETII
jgi:hypothetical protein